MQSPWQHLLELVVQLARVLAFFSVVVLPATWVFWRRCPSLTPIARIALGTATGFSIFVISSWYIGLWSLDYLPLFWIAQFVVAACLGLHCVRGGALKSGTEGDGVSHPADERRASWLIVATLLAGAVLQLYALHFSKLPKGVDPAFHCVVGQRQFDARRATMDLWPLEDLRLNYPIGSHLWLAVTARWTGLEIHEVFRHSFTLAMWGAALCIAAWGERLFGSPKSGAAASFVFMFGSYQASFFPYTWGGLPSSLAMWQGLAALYCVLHLRGIEGVFSGMLLFAGTAMTHHHTMVALLGGVGLLACCGVLLSSTHRELSGRVLISLVGSACFAAVYVVPLVTRVTQLGQTGTLAYSEPFGWPWEHLWSWGPGLLLTAGIGLIVQGSPGSRASRLFLLLLAAFWTIAFVLLDYGGRAAGVWFRGMPSTPFTPSRFVFDLQFMLAIFAGGGLVRLLGWLRVRAIQFALLAGIVAWSIWQTLPRWEPIASDILIPIGQWARSNLPENALIVWPENIWLTYVCRRESTSLFIPISESAATTRRQLKASLHHQPRQTTWDEWSRALNAPLFVISSAWDTSWRRPPIFVAGALGIYELTPPNP